MERFEDYVEQVKGRNPIVDVIQETVPLKKEGARYRGRGTGASSLIVEPRKQCYHWNSKSESGDVIHWVMHRQATDFKGAVEILARRAKLPEPNWGKQDPQQRIAARARSDAFSVAATQFMIWLRADKAALEYAHKRGWKDTTLFGEDGTRGAGLGFTGWRSEISERVAEMKRSFLAMQVDVESAAAVSILGYQGDVAKWAKRHDLNIAETNPDWIEKKRIPGLIGRGMLVYPHWKSGSVRYFSGRGVREKAHFNLPIVLVGNRQPYFNTAWSPREAACVVVEGQADAITLAQWGVPAVALAGTNADAGLKELLKGHETLYVGLDADDAGEANAWKVAEALGPMTRLVHWPRLEDVKDANDWLQAMIERGNTAEQQLANMQLLMVQAPTLVEAVAHHAGTLRGAEQDAEQRRAVSLIERLDPMTFAQYRVRLAKAMGIGVRDLSGMVKVTAKAPAADGAIETEELIGGYLDDHLIELLYDPETTRTRFAVRFPDKHSEVVDELKMDYVKYIPVFPNQIMRKNVVLFPSDLPPVRPTRELVTIVKNFIHRYLDVDDFYERLSAYYVLFTWVYDSFQVLPYLRALGDYGTGKTRLIQTIGVLCYRPIFTGGATTTSPIFRMLDRYRGTLVMDEADFSRSDEASDIIKIMNSGYMQGIAVLRSKDAGGGNWDIEVFNVFGPKILATRKKFQDQATESRCLTKEMGGGVPRDDIPIVLPKDFWRQAREIRNLLLAYRMKNWQAEADVDYNSADRAIEPRLNQVTLALKTIVGDDERMVEEIDGFIREYNRQLVVERSMTPEAKVLEAIVDIHNGDKTKLTADGSLTWDFSLKNIREVTNKLMNAENFGTDEEDAPSNGKKMTAKGVGHYIRTKLNLGTERRRDGYHLVWDGRRIEALKRRYGILDGSEGKHEG